MKKIILILIVILLSPVTMGSERWDKTDKALFTSFLVLETIDCLQTRDILSNQKFDERNPIIKNAGKTEATAYFALCSIGTYWIADRLKPKHRKIFLTGISLFQVSVINHNYRAGVKLRF